MVENIAEEERSLNTGFESSGETSRMRGAEHSEEGGTESNEENDEERYQTHHFTRRVCSSNICGSVLMTTEESTTTGRRWRAIYPSYQGDFDVS